ncbi:uncharacterized protein C8orf88 homolog [Chanos chanos]|uniref:Uncharacterized protein C8orf88 homolog n=1 Tax=Chanos chanos TaxID=29144 RepID=A0A6J2W4E4_CHACN|nr:uncharacterized protein C8orf88 homolog [Chanos chanos]
MEVSRRRVRHLEPARPLRRLNINQGKSINKIGVEQFYEILQLHCQSQPPAKRERILYSREFLLSMATSPMAKRKPDFLPEHPVVLEKARSFDAQMMAVNRCHGKWDV